MRAGPMAFKRETMPRAAAVVDMGRAEVAAARPAAVVAAEVALEGVEQAFRRWMALPVPDSMAVMEARATTGQAGFVPRVVRGGIVLRLAMGIPPPGGSCIWAPAAAAGAASLRAVVAAALQAVVPSTFKGP